MSNQTFCKAKTKDGTACTQCAAQTGWAAGSGYCREHADTKYEERGQETRRRAAREAEWQRETAEARAEMEAEMVRWKKKWPWKRWGQKSPKKWFQQEEATRERQRYEERRCWATAENDAQVFGVHVAAVPNKPSQRTMMTPEEAARASEDGNRVRAAQLRWRRKEALRQEQLARTKQQLAQTKAQPSTVHHHHHDSRSGGGGSGNGMLGGVGLGLMLSGAVDPAAALVGSTIMGFGNSVIL